MSKSTDGIFYCSEKFSLGIEISLFGWNRYLSNWNFQNVNSHCWRLYWNESPGAAVISGRRKFKLEHDRVILIPPYTDFSTVSEGVFSHFYIHFNTGNSFEHIKREVIVLASDFIQKRIGGHDEDFFDPEQKLNVVMMIVEALSRLTGDRFMSPEKPVIHPKIRQAIGMMNSDSSRNLTCKDIARRLQMPLNTYYALFLQQMKMTSKQYLLNVRMERAVFMLLHTEAGIDEIAEKTDFADRYHFSKAFKARFQIPPAAYRRKCRESQQGEVLA